MKPTVSIFTKYKWQIACVLIFSLNFFLKIIFVTASEIGLDEPFTLFNSQLNFHQLFELLKTENNPPLHFILMHFWIKYFGVGVVSARFLSILFSAATPVVMLQICKRFFSFEIGLVTSLIFTGASIQYFYAHDARVYTLFVFLSTLNLYYFLRIVFAEKLASRPTILLFIVTNILLCYAHYFGFIIIGVELIGCFAIKNVRQHLKTILLSFGILIISYSIYIPTLLHQFSVSAKGTWIEPSILSDLYTMLWRFSNTPIQTVLFILAICTFFIKGKPIHKEIKNGFRVIFTLFIINFVGLFLISKFIPIFIDRYLLFTSVYFYFLVGISLTYLFKSHKILIGGSLVIACSMFATVDLKRGKQSNVKEMANYVKQQLTREYNVVISPEWLGLNFIYYYNRSWFTNPEQMRDSLRTNHFYSINNIEGISQLNKQLPILFINSNNKDTTIDKFLRNNYLFSEQKMFEKQIVVTTYLIREKK